jgi:hypothetical protein
MIVGEDFTTILIPMKIHQISKHVPEKLSSLEPVKRGRIQKDTSDKPLPAEEKWKESRRKKAHRKREHENEVQKSKRDGTSVMSIDAKETVKGESSLEFDSKSM